MTDSQNLLDHPLLTEVLFYPSRITEDEVPREPGGRILQVPAGPDRLGAYLFSPLASAPTALFFHGNGEVMTDYLLDYHHQVCSLGANFLVADYRGYGLSSGSPSLSRLLEDARAVWTYAVNELGLSAEQIILMGRSLGSLAALELAGGPGAKAQALILESGIARFDDWISRMGPFLLRLGLDVNRLQEALRAAFNHEAKLKAFPGPVLILHAQHDEIVPVEHAKLLAGWSDPARTTLRIFPRGGHNDIHFQNRDSYFQTIQAFLARTR